jgi:hypothetical protein
MTETQLGEAALRIADEKVSGEVIERQGEDFYRIANFDRMPAFFIAVVSGYDHWMYVSSTGGITCGRRNPDLALFPYETDDRIHDSSHTAGPFTAIKARVGETSHYWEPFCRYPQVYGVERNLYKSLVGNRLVFEEINHDLGLSLEYEWSNGDRFGFIRRAALRNRGDASVQIELIDGLRNLLPFGSWASMQTGYSTLLNAYRQAELTESGIAALYTLSSIPSDRAEPSEALKASVVWSHGLEDPTVLLSLDQLEAFRSGRPVKNEPSRHGQRTDYLLHHSMDIEPGGRSEWRIAADVALGPSDTVALLSEIENGMAATEIEEDITRGTQRIRELAQAADAFQQTRDPLAVARHFSNTLFNIMRGGVFPGGYQVPVDDFRRFARAWNRDLADQLETVTGGIGPVLSRQELLKRCEAANNAGLQRLALEYLPLSFSRRHGDPSRPWNHFDIDIRHPDGTDKLSYQGNWRDIFQNWEALALSYPDYLGSFIAKFVNASTPDGYNPYRITQDGIDWETLDPHDEWSNIGYWGDHQVNYLLRLLELSNSYNPGEMQRYLDQEIFVYANVPYRIKGYRALLKDPRNTVEFDQPRADEIDRRISQVGSDGRLVALENGEIYRVSLLEKLLVTALAKLGNFVPGGGIWMNTQRPEWNDANNALVGFGLSMVTLCYLRRYLAFLQELLQSADQTAFQVSTEVCRFFEGARELFANGAPQTGEAIRDEVRKEFMDRMGEVAETYRSRVYSGMSGRKSEIASSDLVSFISSVLTQLDDCIARNRREDGLYHAYNLLNLDKSGHGVDHLQEMLEGQVAVLSAGVLSPEDALAMLDALRDSRMYRSDQNSYTLYPADSLPGFLEKNVIPEALVSGNDWIQSELAADGSQFVEQDINGQAHFNGRFRNAEELREALDLERDLDESGIESACAVFETTFRHQRFTGRSGAMYKYEGLGCIYWHMVSKLLLAIGETLETTPRSLAEVRNGLLAHYDQVKDGIGAHKSPEEYGAFPMDPYSHTPGFSGVQQPGMTGQVKEDVISRFAELGVRVSNGQIGFLPSGLKKSEFFEEAVAWSSPATGSAGADNLPAGALAFTVCGVPVVYRLADSPAIHLHLADGSTRDIVGERLDPDSSRSLFMREGDILRIDVDIDVRQLR